MKKLLLLLLLCAPYVYGQTITTVAGNGVGTYCCDSAQATDAEIDFPFNIAFDAQGNYYFTDALNYRVRKVSPSGTITTFAGTGVEGNTGDGGLATLARLDYLEGIAVDNDNNVYISSGSNIVRKIDNNGIITTFAGTGVVGYSGDGQLATTAQLSAPIGLATDNAGNLYIADNANNVVRKVNASGIISTIAGNGTSEYTGDGGPATSAGLVSPVEVTVDNANNIYISDNPNSIQAGADNAIRKISSNGIISTYAGGVLGYQNDTIATSSQLYSPGQLACDNAGNLYISERARIRMVTTDCIIHTIAGTGTLGFTGDGGPAISATLNIATGVALDAASNVYICDSHTNRIRKVTNPLAIPNVTSNKFTLSPNPVYNELSITAATKIDRVDIVDVVGHSVFSATYNSENVKVNVSALSAGMYFVRVNNSVVQKIIKE